MNDTTRARPPGTDGPNGFEGTVKDFWASRPRRPRKGRKLAGVAAGVGQRYSIDPVVIRVALVITTVLGGVGVAVYLLGWLFLPDERDEVSPVEALVGKGRSGASTLFTLCLCVALIPVLSWTFAGSWFDGGGFIGLGLLAAALYLLHQERGQHNRPAAAGENARTFTTTAGAPAAFSSTDAAQDERADPPAWDPLGAAPLAWDLPDRSATGSGPPEGRFPAQEPAGQCRRRRGRSSRVGFIAFAIAMMVGGIGAGLAASNVAWFSAGHVIGLVVGVLGIGLVSAAFTGSGRGLIWPALPLGLVGVAMTAFPSHGLHGGVGSLHRSPSSQAALRPSYERAMGDITLDMTQLPPSSKPADLSVQLGLGSATVVVPPDADVTYTCSSGIGDVDCFGRTSEGIGTPEVSGNSADPDGSGGQQIELDVTAGVGSVEVRRG